ncbi:glucosamine-6-phosphate deaminase [Haloferula sp. BvORR071]|uniref:glucosamine-6-phosphate deaminase n=1 Tax=Haloferula sp. BvORR071 TaxID=1396141 RepID=UPI00054D1A3F|nr:glucosamine-6-phosphate deaminase [Haloferula sp. BvORR071]
MPASPLREFTVDQLKVALFEDRESLGAAAAVKTAAAIRRLQETQPTVRMIFAAAPSQNEFLDALIRESGIDWQRVHAFHMDEYVGLADDAPQRFGNFLDTRLFRKLPFGAVHYIDGNAADPQAECHRYASLLREQPVDITCMGIGENCHIAFNDPHVADFQDPELVKLVELDETSRHQQVHDGCFATLDQVPKLAITLTIPALVAAPEISCMVPAAHKAEAVRHTLQDEISEEYPSTILRRHAKAELFIDQDSAREL